MPAICASVRQAASRAVASNLAIAHRSWGERPAAAALACSWSGAAPSAGGATPRIEAANNARPARRILSRFITSSLTDSLLSLYSAVGHGPEHEPARPRRPSLIDIRQQIGAGPLATPCPPRAASRNHTNGPRACPQLRDRSRVWAVV